MILKGIPASPGKGWGQVFVWERPTSTTNEPVTGIEIDAELLLLQQAISKTRETLKQIKKRLKNDNIQEEANIFDVHLTFLDDPTLIEEIKKTITTDKVNAITAVRNVFCKWKKELSSLKDDYLRSRILDVEDVESRIIQHLSAKKEKITSSDFFPRLDKQTILIAEDIYPSELVQMERINLKGIVLQRGSPSSHTALLAKSLNIPMIVGLKGIVNCCKREDAMYIDGDTGKVELNPVFIEIKNNLTQKPKEHFPSFTKDAITKDGQKITVMANIHLVEEIDTAKKLGAEGIGLFRTEFFYMTGEKTPAAEVEFYKETLKKIAPYPVTFRTVDFGADKPLPGRKWPSEKNPALGWRGIRFSLKEKKLFTAQMKAIVKASLYGNCKIMWPMVTTVEEVVAAQKILKKITTELQREGLPVKEIQTGIMVEVPSVAILISQFARKLDFFSLGTNDLSQYILAADRDNPHVNYLLNPFHPSLLNLIYTSVQEAKRYKKKISICGELASLPLALPLLLGMGIEEISVTPSVIPEVKRIINLLEIKKAQEIALKILAMSRSSIVENALREFLETEGIDIKQLKEKTDQT